MPDFEKIARPSCPQLDAMLGQPLHVTGQPHSFVRVIDYMGDEAAIVQAARVSYGPGTKTPSDDRGLIRYLLRHWHTTPFEMCELKLHLKMPMAIAEQLLRHRTASPNKISGRYSVMPEEFFIPAPEFIGVQSVQNKQGRDELIDYPLAEEIVTRMNEHAARSYALYEELVEEGGRYGMARELARFNLPANLYTEMYWKIDLHNLLHFLRLRLDSHAQTEIRQVANSMADVVSAWLPNVWKAFEDYRLEAVTFSGPEMTALLSILDRAGWNEAESQAIRSDLSGLASRLSAREMREFEAKLGHLLP